MSKPISVIAVLVSALAIGAAAPAAAPAAAGAAGTATTLTTGAQPLRTQQARFGGGFRARPSFGSRYRYRSRYPGYGRGFGRPHAFRGLGGSILRALGFAYLFHALFGWGGGGGSPFGLLIVIGVIAWIATRRRRRYAAY
jgi:hypothetical protein